MLYRCQIEIDVDAEDPKHAAVEAYETLKDPAAMPWVVDVFSVAEDGELRSDAKATRIDLNDVLGDEDVF